MKSKSGKLLALFLALTLAAGLMPLRTFAAGEVSSFADVTDPEVGQAVEILRTMGVVNGADDGKYHPERNLTRAEFCKMTVLIMGEGNNMGAYETSVIFPDVTSSHWALGYINYASQRMVGSGEEQKRLVAGTNEGLFCPDKPISYYEAFTILLRVLGYGEEADSNWPVSAQAQAIKLGLTEDLGAFKGSADIDRGSAALLFRNMLMTAPSGSKTTYIESRATLTKNMIYFSSEVSAEGLHFLTIDTSGVKDAYIRPGQVIPGDFLLGRRGTAVTDTASGILLAFIPESGPALRTVTVRTVTSKAITTRDGEVISVPATATVLPEKEGGSSFMRRYLELDFPGTVLTLIYSTTGNVEYILISEAETVTGLPYVAESDGSGAFDAATGGRRDCRIIKNGTEIPYSAVKKYDVGIYDEKANTVYVSDFRLTAMYEQAKDNNIYVPSKIKLLGTEFDVQETALPDFENIKPGEVITALFAADGSVASVRAQSEVSGNAVGIAKGSVASEDGFSEAISIELINIPENAAKNVSGPLLYGGKPSSYEGQIVNVVGTARQNSKTRETTSYLQLSRVTNGISGDFDVSGQFLGKYPLTENAVIYDKVKNTALHKVSISDISIRTVPADKITFARLNSSDKVDLIVMEDVTGDLYTYGIITHDTKVTDRWEGEDIFNNVTIVSCVNDKNSQDNISVIGTYGDKGSFGGIVESDVMLGDVPRCANYVSLTKIENITRSDFDVKSGTFSKGNVTMPVAGAVRFYDNASGLWITDIDWTDFILYNKSLSVYYDRTPETGGKVRIIVAE